jgi:hypothetical protein
MWLERLQKEFIGYLYSPKPSEGEKLMMQNFFLDPGKPDPGNGLKTYRSNLVFGLLSALRETYPFTHALLGGNNFNFLGREYIYSHPSRNGDLMEYGAEFDGFLAGRGEVANLPFLPEVAGLEWAMDRAFYSELASSLSFKTAISGKDPGSIKLKFPSSLKLLRTQYQVIKYWRQFRDGGLDRVSNHPFPPGEENIVVWGSEGLPRECLVNSLVGSFLKDLLQGAPLSQAGEGLFQKDPAVFSKALQYLFEQGWIADVEDPA